MWGADFTAYSPGACERNTDTSSAHKLNGTLGCRLSSHLMHSNRNKGASLLSVNTALLSYPLQTISNTHFFQIFSKCLFYNLYIIIYIKSIHPNYICKSKIYNVKSNDKLQFSWNIDQFCIKSVCNQRVYLEGPMAPAEYVAEDGFIGHQWEKRPLVLWRLDAPL